MTGPTPFAPGNGISVNVTMMYEAAVPAQIVNPNVNRPYVYIGKLSGGGHFFGERQVNMTWVGPGNKWTVTFEAIQQKEYLIRVDDIARGVIECPQCIGPAYNNTITSSHFDIVGRGADPIGGWLKIRIH